MKRVIIDTDAGVDDALAIILALKSPELKVEAITTVAGNVEVEKCTRNCLLLLDILDPAYSPIVAQGAKKPLVKDLVTAPEVHGEDGLGNVVAQYPTPGHKAVRDHAMFVILDLIRKYPGSITIVTIGPMTNLALAINKDIQTMRDVREIITMGGAFRVPGNTGPFAEFNMYVDPEAAQRVLDAGLPLTLLPLDVTEKVFLRWHEILNLRQHGDKSLGNFIAEFTCSYMRYHKETVGFFGGYLHDPLAVGVAINTNFVRCRDLSVAVKTTGDSERGMTVAEPRRSQKKWHPNARVAQSVKSKEFLQFFQSRVWS